MRRSVLVEGYGMPLGPGTGRDPAPRTNLAGTHRGPAGRSRPAPARSRSSRRRLRLGKTRQTLTNLGLRGQIAHKGEKPPIRASRPWHLERTNAWHNAFNRFQRCYERHEQVIGAFFDLADTIIAVRSLIRRALDHPPLGHPTYPTTVINTSIRATSKARR
jgi:hypothetical protein